MGVVCACGTKLGTPRCSFCNTPGDHPHQLNSGRWACTACNKTFTYPRGRKANKKRQKFTNAKGSKSVKNIVLSQMSPSDNDTSMEAILAQMLVEKINRQNTLDGSATAKFVNSVSNLLAPCHVIMKRATTQQTADVVVDLPQRVSSPGHEFVLVANRTTSYTNSSAYGQDSFDEIRLDSCEDMISESFDNQLNSSCESYSDDTDFHDADFDSVVSPPATCTTF